MKRAIIVGLLSMLASVAQAQFNGCPTGFCPSVFGGGGKLTPLVSCASTGTYDLSNTCNDIYFIGALK